MPVHALLFTHDLNVKKVFRDVFEVASIRCLQAGSWVEALAQLKQNRFDAIVVDEEVDADALDLFKALRSGKFNRNAIGYAVLRERERSKAAYQAGAHMVMLKPLSTEVVARSVKATHGLILTQRRRYHRHHLTLTGNLLLANTEDLPVDILNLSESGAALHLRKSTHHVIEGEARLRFSLPDTPVLEAKCLITWTAEGGRFGVQFTRMRSAVREQLDDWLHKSMERSPIYKNAGNAMRALSAKS
jgi:DNA-binding response OmpR family regulator